jgi:hypothetical protein
VAYSPGIVFVVEHLPSLVIGRPPAVTAGVPAGDDPRIGPGPKGDAVGHMRGFLPSRLQKRDGPATLQTMAHPSRRHRTEWGQKKTHARELGQPYCAGGLVSPRGPSGCRPRPPRSTVLPRSREVWETNWRGCRNGAMRPPWCIGFRKPTIECQLPIRGPTPVQDPRAADKSRTGIKLIGRADSWPQRFSGRRVLLGSASVPPAALFPGVQNSLLKNPIRCYQGSRKPYKRWSLVFISWAFSPRA